MTLHSLRCSTCYVVGAHLGDYVYRCCSTTIHGYDSFTDSWCILRYTGDFVTFVVTIDEPDIYYIHTFGDYGDTLLSVDCTHHLLPLHGRCSDLFVVATLFIHGPRFTFDW